jgi:hypothetical protein
MFRRSAFSGLLLGLLVAASVDAQSSTFCHDAVQACTDPRYLDCAQIPTSLRPLETLPTAADGWLPGGVCGTRSCMMLFRCPCGNSLSKSVCIEGGGSGACDCGPQSGQPCEYLVTTLNKMLEPRTLTRPDTPPPVPVKMYIPAGREPGLNAKHRELLEGWRRFFEKLASVELEAGVWLNFPGRNGEGELKYLASGSKYWLRAVADHRMGLAPSLEAAYDGKFHQILYLDDSRLSLWRKDPRQIPAPFPNPFYLPVSFLGLSGESCDACEWKADDIRDSNRWLQRFNLGRSDAAGSFLLPGGTLHETPFYYRITLDEGGLISKIESVLSSGKVFRAVELTNYQQVERSQQKYPHHLLVAVFDENGETLGTVHYGVKALRVNGRMKSNKFTIPKTDAQIVIDEDVPTFLKHPRLAKPPGRPEEE